MAELKTKATTASVRDFIASVADETRRKECETVLDLMARATSAEPRMWGSSIVGFGRYRYKYETGREGEWMLTGFSPRKSDLTIYILPGLDEFTALTTRLGKFKSGKSCLYVKRLSDVDLDVLRQLVGESVARLANSRIE